MTRAGDLAAWRLRAEPADWAIGLLVGVCLTFHGVRALIAARELKQATAY